MNAFIALVLVFGLIALLFSLVIRMLGGHKADETPQDNDDPRISPQEAYRLLYIIGLRGGILLLFIGGFLYYVSS